MGNGKSLLIAALVISMNFINSPSKSTDKPNHGSNIPYMEKDSFNSVDERMFVYPKRNCDPKMLIPCNPNIDPGFILKKLP
jgi:hypothetical protein